MNKAVKHSDPRTDFVWVLFERSPLLVLVVTLLVDGENTYFLFRVAISISLLVSFFNNRAARLLCHHGLRGVLWLWM